MIRFRKRASSTLKISFSETSCFTPELARLFYSKYDPERLNLKRTDHIKKADILLLNGYTQKVLREMELEYESMEDKPLVIGVGGCAIQGGPLKAPRTTLRVSVFIPGCPPRPEALINGILKGLDKE